MTTTLETKEAERTVTEPVEPKLGRKRRIAFGVLAVVLLAAGVGGTIYYMDARQYESTDDAFIDGNIVAVSSKVAGRVAQVFVQENQEVSAGTVLVKIDARDFEARVQQAQAAYDAALAKLDVAKTAIELTRASTDSALKDATAAVEQSQAAVRTAQAQLESASADVAAAEAENSRRESDLKRYQSLDERVVTQQQLDTARAAAEASRAALTATKKRVSAAESAIVEVQAKVAQKQATLAYAKTAPQQVASAVAQCRNAQAAVEQAKATLDAARLELSYTTITAPIGGRLAKKSVQPGQFVQIGQSMMAIVEPEVWITANFKETQLTRMRAGQDVDIRVDAYPGKRFKGQVQSIQAGTGARFSLMPAENATGNYVKVVQRMPVKIVFSGSEDREYLLAPGMSAEPKVKVGTDDSSHPAPITAPVESETSAK